MAILKENELEQLGKLSLILIEPLLLCLAPCTVLVIIDISENFFSLLLNFHGLFDII